MKPHHRIIEPADYQKEVTLPVKRSELITLQNMLIERIEAHLEAGQSFADLDRLAAKLEYYLTDQTTTK